MSPYYVPRKLIYYKAQGRREWGYTIKDRRIISYRIETGTCQLNSIVLFMVIMKIHELRSCMYTICESFIRCKRLLLLISLVKMITYLCPVYHSIIAV
jgi:hypothetical protein